MWISLAATILKPACSMRRDDLPGHALGHGVGLDDGQRALASSRPITLATVAPMSAGLLHQRGAGRLQRLHLLGRRPLAAGDDRAGVAHPAAGRRRLPADERRPPASSRGP